MDFDGTVVQAVGGAVYYSGCAAANMGHKIAVLPKADLSQLDVTAAFHEKAPSISVFPLNSPHSFVTKNVYHTADRERRTSTVDSLIAPYTTDEVPVDQIDAAIWHLAGLAGGACEALDHMDINGIVGTLAGENTVFVVMRDNASAETFCQEIQEML